MEKDQQPDAPASQASEQNPAAQPPQQPDNSIRVEGIIDLDNSRNGQLLDPTRFGKRRPTDPFVPRELIRRFKLNQGSLVTALATPDPRFPNPKVRFIEKVDGLDVDERRKMIDFPNLLTITPNEHLKLELKDGRLTTRVVDLFCPIGKGTRGLIVAPPRTGKTTMLRDMALGVLENHPECHVMILLVDERPEEVTDFKRSVPAEVWASSNDESVENHIRVADLCIERAKRMVEAGKDVVLFLDSLTRLARAHNTQRNSGRTGSGGLDVRALEKPRQLFASARNTEDGGSLTIIASILVETGSRMDDVIYEEFKGTGNMEVHLERKIAERRIFPAIKINRSGTRREELLMKPDEVQKVWILRRLLASMDEVAAMEFLLERLKNTKSNAEFFASMKA